MAKNTVKLAVQQAETLTPDTSKCIICQESTGEGTSSTENGRKRVREAASIRDDSVSKRLRLIGDEENFVYHMTNQCYRKYTLRKSLDRIQSKDSVTQDDENSRSRSSDQPGVHPKVQRRSKSTTRPGPTKECDIYKTKCVVCGNVKQRGAYEKHRISETERAKKFLKATIFMQDEVFTRTCDLQDAQSVFGADLYCHKLCIRDYLIKYDRACKDKSSTKSDCKQKAWSDVAEQLETRLSKGEGFELSYIRDCVNEKIASGSKVTNQQVKVLVMNHFGERIKFSWPKQLNKSALVFSANVTSEAMAETIRGSDPIRQCATLIRQSLMEVDFDLQDRFCDANDLRLAWENTTIPEPLLKFMSVLFKFDMNAFKTKQQNMAQMLEEQIDDEDQASSAADCSGVPKSKVLQMHSLFQVIHYNLHRKRTPLHMMNSQAIYDSSKSRTVITSFNRFGLCSSYDEVQRHHNDMAMFTVESSERDVPFPSHFDPSMFTSGAFDNFDHDEGTLSGMGGSHDTVTVLFQDDGTNQTSKPKVSETPIQHGPRSFEAQLKCQELRQFYKPSKKPDLPQNYTVADTHPVNEALLSDVRAKDIAWQLGRLDLGDLDPETLNTKPTTQLMPIWSAANAVLSEEDIPLKRIAFLPVLPYPVTRYDAVYTALKNLQCILSSLDQTVIPVTCDEGVYRIAREIQLLRPDEFKNVVLCMGSFHMAKVALGCIGKYLKGSGAISILTESSVFGPNVVDSVLNGKHYVRSLKGLQMLKDALSRLQWAEFLKQDDIMGKYEEQLRILFEMKDRVAQKSRAASVSSLHQFQDTAGELIGAFDHFIEARRAESETFRFWDTFILMMQSLENLIRSDREGNWPLQLQAIQELLPLFAACDATNYLRWCALYLEDMHKLPETAPDVHEAFMAGKFVVKRTQGHFKAVGADMALEQTINRSQKSSSGIIGSTRRKQYVTRWELIHHEMLAITNLHREISDVNTGCYELELNRSFNTATTESDEKNIQSIIDVIERTENPFVSPALEPRLHNIQTREVMTDEIRNQLLHVRDIGLSSYEKLRKERFVDKTTRLFETIHRTNLKTFSSIHKPGQAQMASGKSSTSRDGQMQKVLEVARARGTSMEELLRYDVSSSSPLFDEDGFMTKATKSDIVKELEQHLDGDDSRTLQTTNDKLQTLYILDVMAAVRKIASKSHSNFGQLCDDVLKHAKNLSKGANRIDLVFDSYLEKSIKSSERQRREKKLPIELHEISRETPLLVDMERFWPSSSNKLKLEKLLHQEALRQGTRLFPNIQVVASHFTGGEDTSVPCSMLSIRGSCSEVKELKLDIEEADMRIIPHAEQAVKHGIEQIIVLSPDTDVMIMMLYYWEHLHSLGLKELWVRAGVGESTRFISLHTLALRIGRDLCTVLPAVHTLTGSDYTSKLGTKHAALRADPVRYLRQFGIWTDDIDSSVTRSEEYLMQVLKKSTSCQTADQLRAYIYHRSKNLNFSGLPPTSHALEQHILRALYATHQMTSMLSPNAPVLDPAHYGFEECGEILIPVVAEHPIPEELAIFCNCGKCASGRCNCRSNQLPCCGFCKCQSGSEGSCKNPSGTLTR